MTTDSEDRASRVAALDATIRARHTAKLLREPAASEGSPLDDARRTALDEMIALAGFAPFHRRAHEDTHRRGPLPSIVPWRFHVLEPPACRKLLDEILRRAETSGDPKWQRASGSKIPALIAATGALIQVTWLPDPPRPDGGDAFADEDVEHVAAAAAAVQNLLLAAEARGWYGYWSSGGVLRDPEVFDLLGIARVERLLGSIFLAPPGAPFDSERPGGLRDRRGEPGDWSRRVTL